MASGSEPNLEHSPQVPNSLTAVYAVPQAALFYDLEGFLQAAPKVQSAYSMLCSEALIADGANNTYPNMPSISPSAYWQGLQTDAAIQQMSVCNATQKLRDKGMEEIAVWLHKNVPGRGLTNCLPEDVIATW